MGYEARADLPIYVAALSPNMIRLAGEVADGVMLWLCCPSYIESTVIPALREGVEASGRSFEDFDVVAAVPTALTDDPEAARATLRQDLIPYASLPFYRAMLEASGFGDELAAFDEGMAAGDVERAKAGLSDRMLGELAGIGSTGRRPGGGRPLPGRGRHLARDRRAAGHRLRRRARGGRRADRLRAPCYTTSPSAFGASPFGRRGTSTVRLNSATRVLSCL